MNTADNWNALMLAVYEGCTTEEALFVFGLTDKCRHGVGRKRTWSVQNIVRIKELRDEGYSWNKIGRMFGKDGGTMYSQFYRYAPDVFEDWELTT